MTARPARRAAGTRTVTDILLLRFLRRSPERDIADLELLRSGDGSVRPISVSCFCRGCDRNDTDRARLGHLLLDGRTVRYVAKSGAALDLTAERAVLKGVAGRPGPGTVKKGLFTEVVAQRRVGDLRLSVPNVDVLLVQTALDASAEGHQP